MITDIDTQHFHAFLHIWKKTTGVCSRDVDGVEKQVRAIEHN
jgi:hypothetical protein